MSIKKVAIVGSGGMARTHARQWAKMPNIELTGILSVDPETSTAFAAQVGAPEFVDFAGLTASGPDIVDICTPTPTHMDLALQAIAAGKHVFLEKPMARTLAQCDELILAAKSAGVIMMVGHVLRFFPEYAAAKRRVESGAVGSPAAIRTARLAGFPRGGWKNWYGDSALSGGVVLDMIIHDFDWIRWCFGDVDRVFAKGLYGQAKYAGSLDYALVTLRLASGALAHVCGSWAHTGGFRTTFEICGDKGMMTHDSETSGSFSLSLRNAPGKAGPGVAVPESPMQPLDDPYYLELKHFTDCIDSGASPMVSLEDARGAVRIALAALESIETGKPVHL